MIDFTLWDIVSNLLYAARWTIVLSLVTFVLGGLLGFAVLLARISRWRVLQLVSRAYIEVIQGTPLLMQLFLVFFALSLAGVTLPPFVAACVALVIWCSGFLAEIWRGCVNSIVRGQWEASASLAMSPSQQLHWIILPQAARIAVPPTVGFLVQVAKGTALTSLIGLLELSRTGSMIANATFQPFLVYGCVAVIYFVLCWPLARWSKILEKKLHAPHRNH